MNKNTVPEVRPDVNGKLVTRHVKPTQTKTSAPRVPAPAAPPSSTTNYIANIGIVKNAIDEAIQTGAYDEIEDVQPIFIHRVLENLQPHVVEAYAQQISSTPDVGYEDLLISVLTNRYSSEQSGYILFIAQQALPNYGLSNEWDEDARGTFEFDNSVKVLTGLTYFYKETNGKMPKDILKADTQSYEEVAALVSLIKLGDRSSIPGIEDEYESQMFTITDLALGNLAKDYTNDVPRIVDLIEAHNIEPDQVRSVFKLEAEYPDHADRIISVMVERGLSDPEAVREVINAEVQALSNGVL